MTQDQLAAKVGVSQQHISLLEQGASTPSLDVLKKLARAFDVAVTELLE